MQLFKRMMLSLFPDEVVNNPMNPASMFVGFISAKQYFSVITRKIVENYKLNLFDISLDPFEVKIGFGDTPTIKVKDVDFYYGYAAAANLNGYRSFAPGQVAHAVALVASTYCAKIADEYEDYYTLQFIYAIYLLTFLFQGRVKKFPNVSREDDFSWFIELLFSLYIFLLDQTGQKYSKDIVQQIKHTMLKEHVDMFFMLFYFYQYCSDSLDIISINTQQFFGWFFYDELKGGPLQPLVQDFVTLIDSTQKQPFFTTTEKNLIHLLFPADILVRYILDGDDIATIIRHLVTPLFPKDQINEYMKSFLVDSTQFEDFVMFITDYTLFKNGYFAALKKYMTHVFQRQDAYEDISSNNMDEWISSIGEGGSIDMSQIPARLKQESETMERLMNFYVTYLGGYWIGRGDSRYMRGFQKDLIHNIHEQIKNSKKDGLYYFSGLLYNYSKNVFYYKYAFENIRAGKEKFHLPFRATFREVYSNKCILRLFESNFIATILQDALPKDIKIYTKNSQILDDFTKAFQKDIVTSIKKKDDTFLMNIYDIYNYFLAEVDLVNPILTYYSQANITALKETLYTIDYWLYYKTLEQLKPIATDLQNKYNDASILGILTTIRETIMGFYMYMTFVQEQAEKKGIASHIDVLMKFYVLDVLNVSDEYSHDIIHILRQVHDTYSHLLKNINDIDDNDGYLQIAWDNRQQYCYNKKTDDIFGGLSGEDIIWLRGFLKTIVYYNKRYIIPSL